MIYEKRGCGTPCVRREDMRQGEKIPSFCLPKEDDAKIRLDEDIYEPSARRPKTKRTRKKRRLAVAFCIAVSLLVLDAKIFDSFCTRAVSAQIKQGVTAALHLTQEKSDSEKAVFHERTLYTLTYSDKVSKEKSENDGTQTNLNNEALSEQAAVTDSGFSQSYADGERLYPITTLDLSAPSPQSLNNDTSLSPDMREISRGRPAALTEISCSDGPTVLILHTHGTESYTQNSDMYPESEDTRSTDTSRNVVRVGAEIAEVLSGFGIETLHCGTMHDEASFINAYSSSAKTVKRYLEEYPSIKIVVDVHRDAIIRENGESVKAAAEIAGESYAQLMFVVGTNELGHSHDGWKSNLSLAAMLQDEISKTYPRLCRSINLRNVPFNQQLCEGYLLLEVGTSANTLDEALRSARAFGENLARIILRHT